MTIAKKLEIKQIFMSNRTITSIQVMNEYIYGPRGFNEHYKINDIEKIRQEVLLLMG